MNAQQFRQLLIDATNQQMATPIIPPGFIEPTTYFKKPAATFGTLNLATSELQVLFDKQGRLVDSKGNTIVAPIATPGGERFTLEAGILQMSRTAAAGAHVVVRPDPDKAQAIGPADPMLGIERQIKYFNTVEAAPFADVTDDADVSASVLPVHRSTINWSASGQKGVRFEVKRRDLKAIGNDVFVDEVLLSLVLGLARQADAVLLAAIKAATPAAFTLAAAAAQGLRIDDLRALVGTNGNGATWRGDGAFTAANIPADLTADTDITVAGAFNRAGVAIHEDVTVTAERRNLQGDLIVTAYANMIPLLPDAAKFWTVGA